VSVPADGVIGSFDLLIHSLTVAAGRTEASR
jgi:hypothetical protein